MSKREKRKRETERQWGRENQCEEVQDQVEGLDVEFVRWCACVSVHVCGILSLLFFFPLLCLVVSAVQGQT